MVSSWICRAEYVISGVSWEIPRVSSLINCAPCTRWRGLYHVGISFWKNKLFFKYSARSLHALRCAPALLNYFLEPQVQQKDRLGRLSTAVVAWTRTRLERRVYWKALLIFLIWMFAFFIRMYALKNFLLLSFIPIFSYWSFVGFKKKTWDPQMSTDFNHQGWIFFVFSQTL